MWKQRWCLGMLKRKTENRTQRTLAAVVEHESIQDLMFGERESAGMLVVALAAQEGSSRALGAGTEAEAEAEAGTEAEAEAEAGKSVVERG